ncbi:MAG: substrate-binding domain-containing protein, partial [Bifidobacteriaceae bacterium]|nr:substrate-binding domain-containing protein [Bifidobacteriaceae bacterium]
MKSNRLAALAACAAAVLAAGACAGGLDPGASDGADPAGGFDDDGCVHVVAAVSSEKVNLFAELAEAFKDSSQAAALDACATIRPVDVTSGDATRHLSAGGDWPTTEDREQWPALWSPASMVWVDRVAAAASPALVEGAKSFTHTPVVLAMPE